MFPSFIDLILYDWFFFVLFFIAGLNPVGFLSLLFHCVPHWSGTCCVVILTCCERFGSTDSALNFFFGKSLFRGDGAARESLNFTAALVLFLNNFYRGFYSSFTSCVIFLSCQLVTFISTIISRRIFLQY